MVSHYSSLIVLFGRWGGQHSSMIRFLSYRPSSPSSGKNCRYCWGWGLEAWKCSYWAHLVLASGKLVLQKWQYPRPTWYEISAVASRTSLASLFSSLVPNIDANISIRLLALWHQTSKLKLSALCSEINLFKLAKSQKIGQLQGMKSAIRNYPGLVAQCP